MIKDLKIYISFKKIMIFIITVMMLILMINILILSMMMIIFRIIPFYSDHNIYNSLISYSHTEKELIGFFFWNTFNPGRMSKAFFFKHEIKQNQY